MALSISKPSVAAESSSNHIVEVSLSNKTDICGCRPQHNYRLQSLLWLVSSIIMIFRLSQHIQYMLLFNLIC
jgi:hypothetical protein